MVCYIGVGSNLGNRLKNIRKAIAHLSEIKGIAIKRLSPIYETEPQGGPQAQRAYFNLVLEVISELTPRDLLSNLKDIENKVGRRPSSDHWSAREIDLDILFCEDAVINDKDLQIPHPLIQERFFVLKPLSDLTPHFRHPLLGMDVATMLKSIKRNGRWKKIEETLQER